MAWKTSVRVSVWLDQNVEKKIYTESVFHKSSMIVGTLHLNPGFRLDFDDLGGSTCDTDVDKACTHDRRGKCEGIPMISHTICQRAYIQNSSCETYGHPWLEPRGGWVGAQGPGSLEGTASTSVL